MQKGFAVEVYATATNGPNTFSITGGSLPQYLIINSGNGRIGGMPLFEGTFNMTLNVTNSFGTTTQNLTVNVADNIDNTPPSTPYGLYDDNHIVNAINPALRDFTLNFVPSENGGSEVSSYEVWIDGTFAVSATSGAAIGGYMPESLDIINLNPATNYAVKIRSKDALGNYSEFSSEITITTLS